MTGPSFPSFHAAGLLGIIALSGRFDGGVKRMVRALGDAKGFGEVFP